jgi:hypothetical protein
MPHIYYRVVVPGRRWRIHSQLVRRSRLGWLGGGEGEEGEAVEGVPGGKEGYEGDGRGVDVGSRRGDKCYVLRRGRDGM